MTWLRELGYEFCDTIVKGDNEPALTSLVETWGRPRAAHGGQMMGIIAQCAVVKATGWWSGRSKRYKELLVQ